MTKQSTKECLTELGEQYPLVTLNTEACTLTFPDLSVTLLDILLIGCDHPAHISTYHATDICGRRCRIIVNCGAEPPKTEITVLGSGSILVSSTITHEKQDELNQSFLSLCHETRAMA